MAGILGVTAVSLPLLGQDSGVFLKWWLMALILGIGFYPLTGRLFASFADKGWLFSKAIGAAVSGFLAWALICGGWLRFTASTVLGVTAASMAACWLFSGLYRKRSKKKTGLPETWDLVLGEEFLFMLIFFLWTYLAGFHPEAHGTEKFMDYGFMAAMMRSETLPAPDIWYSLENINYYYGGQYYAVFLIKLSFSRVEDTYNLMRALAAGLLAAMTFAAVYQMLRTADRRREGCLRRAAPAAGGLLAAGAVVFAGNLHYLIYGVLGKALGWEYGTNYWFANSTRYIGYNPVTDDKCIHEFPCYSFVLGDLHAHVVNTMFVAVMIGLMLAWVLQTEAQFREGDTKTRRFRVFELLASPYVLAGGFLTGLFQFTNYWDFVIYFTVLAICAIYVNLRRFGGRWMPALGAAALQAAEAFLVGTVTALPFTQTFETMVSGVALAQNRTPLYQWLVLWGLPAGLVLAFTLLLAVKYGRYRRLGRTGNSVETQDTPEESIAASAEPSAGGAAPMRPAAGTEPAAGGQGTEGTPPEEEAGTGKTPARGETQETEGETELKAQAAENAENVEKAEGESPEETAAESKKNGPEAISAESEEGPEEKPEEEAEGESPEEAAAESRKNGPEAIFAESEEGQEEKPAGEIEGESPEETAAESKENSPEKGPAEQNRVMTETVSGERKAVLVERVPAETIPKTDGEERRGGPVSGFLLWNRVPDLFAFILGMCGLGLALIPELVYVRDIYENGYARSNTMFKLTYQGFILFGMAMAYIVTRLLLWKKRRVTKLAGAVGLLLLLSTFGYFGNAVYSWFGRVWDPAEYRCLDATRYLENIYPEDAAAIRWLNENVEGNPVVLEANGDSYSNYQRVSAMTGLPTVLGWYVHEWLWRGDTYALNLRSVNIETIYTSDDSALVASLLEEYDVSYIFVGSCEREKYGQISEELLADLGEVVYGPGPGSGGTYVIKLDRTQ